MKKNTEDFEKIILDNIHKNANFVRCEVSGITPAQDEFSGVFEAVFYLSDLHAWTELTSKKLFKIGKIEEKNDIKILSALDKIAKEGKIFISRVELANDMSHRDIRFMGILGEGKRTAGCSDVVTSFVRNFSIEPLNAKERDKRKALVNLSEIVKEIRKNRDESFRGMMGTPSNISLVKQQEAAMKEQEKTKEEERQFREDIHDLAEWVRSERKEAD